jgi:hypothetical protein
MTDLQDMRARLRETRATPTVSSGDGIKIPFGIFAVGAIAVGFAVVTLTPKLYSVQRTATLPAFKEVKERSEESAPAPAPVVAATPIKADYAGKSADEVGGIADAVCAQRLAAAEALPQPTAALLADDAAGGQKIAAANDKLHCFLSEGTARFCSPQQRRKATVDIINYFKGIEYANASVSAVQKAMARPVSAASGAANAATTKLQLTPDPRVVDAVDALLLAGYIAQGNRDDLLANVPRAYRDRFGRIVGNRNPCPEKPWWQAWK